MIFPLLLVAFVAERAHQWQSLVSRDWTVRFQGKEVSRRLVVWTALAIGWGEGLAFYRNSEQTFWTFVFWAYVGHVLLTGVLWSLRSRWKTVMVVLSVFLAMLIPFFDLSRRTAPATWFGRSGLEPAGCMEVPVVFALVIILVVHAIPCFVANLRRAPRLERTRFAAAGLGLACIEWFVAAKFVWFPDGSLFPDLTDWFDLGPGADFWLLPLWMAPFFAHVIIDAIRYFQRPPEPMA